MASPFAEQIANARTLLDAATPTTDSTSGPWEKAGIDLSGESEPPHRRRVFEVRPAADGSVTLEQWGTGYRQALARFEVVWRFDTLADRETAWQAYAEDMDQVVALMEAPSSRVNASVQRVSHVGARLEPGENDHVAAVVATFECLYVHTI